MIGYLWYSVKSSYKNIYLQQHIYMYVIFSSIKEKLTFDKVPRAHIRRTAIHLQQGQHNAVCAPIPGDSRKPRGTPFVVFGQLMHWETPAPCPPLCGTAGHTACWAPACFLGFRWLLFLIFVLNMNERRCAIKCFSCEIIKYILIYLVNVEEYDRIVVRGGV